jgi:hypothetical protein
MYDGRLGRHARLRPRPARSPAEIGFLAVHHVAGVEAAEPIPERAADQEEAALHHLHVAFIVAPPTAEVVRVEDWAVGEDHGQAGGAAEQPPERGVVEDAKRIEAPVAEKRAPAPDPGLRPPRGEGD